MIYGEGVSQKTILLQIKSHLPRAIIEFKNGRTGPDAVLEYRGKRVVVEAIAFSDRTSTGTSKRWKNQADFWKAFSQAISRLNGTGVEGARPDLTVIALPDAFLTVGDWRRRMEQLGPKVWKRIGKAFPELGIWFVGSKGVKKYSWNEAYNPKSVS